MNKSDLKEGMVVEYRDGRRRIVKNGDLHIQGSHRHDLVGYVSGLRDPGDANLSIVKVWASCFPKDLDDLDLGEPLWVAESNITIEVDGKKIVLSDETVKNLKKQLKGTS